MENHDGELLGDRAEGLAQKQQNNSEIQEQEYENYIRRTDRRRPGGAGCSSIPRTGLWGSIAKGKKDGNRAAIHEIRSYDRTPEPELPEADKKKHLGRGRYSNLNSWEDKRGIRVDTPGGQEGGEIRSPYQS